MQRLAAILLRSAKFAVFFALLVAVSFPVQVFAAGNEPPAPTVLTPKHGSFTSERLPRITGVTRNDTRVAVYIDGVFNGDARVANDESGVASFAYVPFLALEQGTHTVFTRAEDISSSARSGLSKTKAFDVAFGLPAPMILKTVVNTATIETQPFIVGLAHGEYKALVYIDGAFNGETMVENARNGLGSFAYKPFLPLERGKTHTVAVKAVDRAMRQSPVSETMTFTVPALAQTTGEAAAIPTTNGTEGDTPESSTTPTESAPAPEQKNEKQTTGEGQKGEVQGVQDQTNTNTSSNKNTNTAATNTEQDKDQDKDGVNRSLVTWVIVLAVLIILAVLRLRSGNDRGNLPPMGGGGGSSTPPSSGGTGGGSGTASGSSGTMPNPPPPSSNY